MIYDGPRGFFFIIIFKFLGKGKNFQKFSKFDEF